VRQPLDFVGDLGAQRLVAVGHGQIEQIARFLDLLVQLQPALDLAAQ